jgi:hypothetical protein
MEAASISETSINFDQTTLYNSRLNNNGYQEHHMEKHVIVTGVIYTLRKDRTNCSSNTYLYVWKMEDRTEPSHLLQCCQLQSKLGGGTISHGQLAFARPSLVLEDSAPEKWREISHYRYEHSNETRLLVSGCTQTAP